MNESEKYADYLCPYCGSKVITYFGPGIEIDYCSNSECDFEEIDYPEIDID